MRYGSVCSGIEAATVAWKPLGWEAAWFSEIEKFPCAVLKHHYPDVPNLGDITTITEADLEKHGPITVLVGGTPCQSFSVAGLRKGMADSRGNLALRFLQLAGATRARWVVWENVPGVRSSWTDEATFAPSEESCRLIREAGLDPGDFEEVDQTADLKCFLDALSELGYGYVYRTLDAEYFGVPQRRNRVFVIGYLGDWRRAAAVLFEKESLRRNPPPSRESGAGVAGTLAPGAHPSGFNGRDAETGNVVAHCLARGKCGSHGKYDPNGEDYVITAAALRARDGSRGVDSDCTDTLIPILEAGARQGHRDGSRDGLGIGQDGAPMFTLQSDHQHAIAFDTTQVTSPDNYSDPKPGDACHPLASGQHPPAVVFDCKQSGEGGEVSPPLRALSHDQSHANAGGQLAVAIQEDNQNGEETRGVSMAVRRLTPL